MLEDGALQAALATLSHRDQRVLEMRFGLGTETAQTLGGVALALALSRAEVRTIEERALNHLRDRPEAQILRNG